MIVAAVVAESPSSLVSFRALPDRTVPGVGMSNFARCSNRSAIHEACAQAGSRPERGRIMAPHASLRNGLNAVLPSALPNGPSSRWLQLIGATSEDWLSASVLLSRKRGGSQTCHWRAMTGMSISGSCDVREESIESGPSSLPHSNTIRTNRRSAGNSNLIAVLVPVRRSPAFARLPPAAAGSTDIAVDGAASVDNVPAVRSVPSTQVE